MPLVLQINFDAFARNGISRASETPRHDNDFETTVSLVDHVGSGGRQADDYDDDGYEDRRGSRHDTPTQGLNVWSLWRGLNIAFLFYLVPSIVILFLVLLMEWHQRCDGLTHAWAIGQIVIQALQFLNTVLFIDRLPNPRAARNGNFRWRRVIVPFFFARLMNVVFIVWYVIGTLLSWKSIGGECAFNAPLLVSVIWWMSVVHSVGIACVALFWCCVPCVVAGYFLARPDDDDTESGSRAASPEAIRGLKSRTYSTGMFKADERCAICLGDYEDTEVLRELPCGHIFHLRCVDAWLPREKSCPCCKRDIDKPAPVTPGGSGKQMNGMSNQASTPSISGLQSSGAQHQADKGGIMDV
eukprot:Opistho-2@52007